ARADELSAGPEAETEHGPEVRIAHGPEAEAADAPVTPPDILTTDEDQTRSLLLTHPMLLRAATFPGAKHGRSLNRRMTWPCRPNRLRQWLRTRKRTLCKMASTSPPRCLRIKTKRRARLWLLKRRAWPQRSKRQARRQSSKQRACVRPLKRRLILSLL